MAGLLDYANEFLKGGKKYRDAVGGLLTGNTDGAKGLMGEVAQLFDPNYMRQIQSTAGRDGMDIALNANPMMASHTVWHGSPHSFNKFDMSKLGTGEGAQAYGHGLYFAESPEVAKSYLVNAGSQKSPEFMAQSYVKDYGNYDEALAGAKNRLNHMINHPPEQVEMQKKVISAIENKNFGGSLYKVDIPDESIPKMLDWDKKLSEQSPEVQKVWSNLVDTAKQRNPKTADVIDEMLRHPKGASGKGFYNSLGGVDRDFKSATNLLKENGIPGIRYLDAESRGHQVDLSYKGSPYATEPMKFSSYEQAKQYSDEMIKKGFGAEIKQVGTSNYVLFDDNLPKILERNGNPLGLLGGTK